MDPVVWSPAGWGIPSVVGAECHERDRHVPIGRPTAEDRAGGHRREAGEDRIANAAFRDVLRDEGRTREVLIDASGPEDRLTLPLAATRVRGEAHNTRSSRALAACNAFLDGGGKGQIGETGVLADAMQPRASIPPAQALILPVEICGEA